MMLSDAELDRLLAEDVPYGDLTTYSLGIGGRSGAMVFRARQPMAVACSEEAARIIEKCGGRVGPVMPSGQWADQGAVILEAEGSAQALLSAWKVAQLLVESASGIATGAHAIVSAARAVRPDVTVACTRKAFPGTRALAVKAILAGGAVPHRLGLSETILVFPEHRVFMGDETLAASLARLKARCPEKKIVVEVKTAAEAIEAALAGAQVVQLEKFTPAQVADLMPRMTQEAPQVVVAAAGGVKAGNAAEYVAAGVHLLVTSAPYQAPPMDVAVSISGLSNPPA